MRRPFSREIRTAFSLLIANIGVSMVHFRHNITFIEHYFEPASLQYWLCFAWIVMTGAGIFGFISLLRGKHAGWWILAIYGAAGLSVLIHYVDHSWRHFTWFMNAAIIAEFMFSLAMLAYCLWEALRK